MAELRIFLTEPPNKNRPTKMTPEGGGSPPLRFELSHGGETSKVAMKEPVGSGIPVHLRADHPNHAVHAWHGVAEMEQPDPC